MSTSSRRISARVNGNRNSHTPGKDKGAFCVRRPDANLAISLNPYKGAGLKGQNRARYERFWNSMIIVNGGTLAKKENA